MKQRYALITLIVSAVSFAPRAGAQVKFNPLPSRILGQAILQQQQVTALGPNLVEGREFDAPQSLAVDTSANPPILYVADSGNNRVLAWKNIQSFKSGAFAELGIGQRDRFSTPAAAPRPASGPAISAPPAGPAGPALNPNRPLPAHTPR